MLDLFKALNKTKKQKTTKIITLIEIFFFSFYFLIKKLTNPPEANKIVDSQIQIINGFV